MDTDKHFKCFYLTDYPGVQEMFNDFMDFLLKPEFSGFKCYAHNFSKYDGPIATGYICNYVDKVKPIYSHNKLYELVVRRGRCKVILRDSLLLAPASLEALSKSLGIDTLKGSFPHEFSSYENLEYMGVSPCGGMED